MFSEERQPFTPEVMHRLPQKGLCIVTPKGFYTVAQGCEQSELPWVEVYEHLYPKGVLHLLNACVILSG